MRDNSFVKCKELIYQTELMYGEFKKNANLYLLAKQEYEESKKQAQDLINKINKYDRNKYIKKE